MAIQDYYESGVQRVIKIKVDNGRGGSTYEWLPDLTFYGLINQATSREVLMANKLGMEIDSKLFCDVNVVLDNDDLILFKGIYYRVKSVPKNTVHRDHHFKIMLKTIDIDKA